MYGFFAKDEADAQSRIERYNNGEASAVTWANSDTFCGSFVAACVGAGPKWTTVRTTIDGVERLVEVSI